MKDLILIALLTSFVIFTLVFLLNSASLKSRPAKNLKLNDKKNSK